MRKHLPLDDTAYAKICGLYDLEQGMAEFYRQDDLLLMKRNGQISEGLVYAGDNTFEGGMGRLKVKFELQDQTSIKAFIHQASFNNPDQVRTSEGTKFLKY